MKSAIILALSSTTLALPFGDVVDAIFGTNEARHIPHPDQMPGFHPIGTGSGTGFPCPTGTGAAFPTASNGFPFRHASRPGHQHRSRTLAIDYQLAPTFTAVPLNNVKRQEGSGSALPSFTLLDPSDVPGVPAPTAEPTAAPTSTDDDSFPLPTEVPEEPVPTFTDDEPFPAPTGEPDSPFPTEDPDSPFPFPTGEPDFPFPTGEPDAPFPFPTGGFPAPTGGFPLPTGGFPTGGFPTGTGLPSLPTTLETVTRGPRPTSQPEFPPFELPGQDDDETKTPGQSWFEFLEELFGNGRSEMGN